MAQKNSFVLQSRMGAVVAKLSDKQAGALFKAIFQYAENGTLVNFEDRMVDIAFTMFRQDIDYTNTKYQETCEKRKEAVQKRWENTKDTNVYKCIPCNTKNTNVKKPIHNDTDTDIDVDIEVDKSTLKEKEVKEKEKPLASAFDRFLNYRKQIKKPFKSQMSIDECYKRLEKLSGGNLNLAEQIVNQSIAQGWQGLFDLKQGANNAAGTGIDFNGKDADLSKYEEFERKNTKVFYSK